MKKLLTILSFSIFILIAACSGDDSTNPTTGLKVDMLVSGDQSVTFKTDDVNIVLPPVNPNYLITAFFTEGGMTHTFSLTIDSKWLDSTRIDLTRDENKAVFAYNQGKDGNTYRVIQGFLDVDEINYNKVKGTLNFTAGKIGEVETTISVANGKINISK